MRPWGVPTVPSAATAIPHLSACEQRVLDAVDARWALDRLVELIAIPSITGSAAESEAQHLLAAHVDRLGLDIDLWAPSPICGCASTDCPTRCPSAP